MRWIILAGMAVVSASSMAYSFAGNDWTFHAEGVLHISTTVVNSDEPFTQSDPVDVSQTQTDKFAFPYGVGPFSGTGDFDVVGNIVTDVNSGKTTDPFTVNFNNTDYLVRVTYPTWSLVGTVTGSNPGQTDAFGARAYEITGDPLTISNVQVEAFLFGNWLDLGSNSSAEISSWNMVRAVPEPATMIALGAGLAGLAARRRKA